MYPKVGKEYIIGKSINKKRFQCGIWNQKMLVFYSNKVVVQAIQILIYK
jgi:hypothetical protein